MKDIKIFLKKKELKGKKKLEKDIKILLKRKKRRQYYQEPRQNYLSIEEVIT